MAQAQFQSVDEYLAAQPETSRPVLERVRLAIRKAVPGADEEISYGMPAYRLQGAVVIYFAGWKHHYSLYPASERLVRAFEDDLAPFEISKGTIRLPLTRPVPAKLIERIAKFRKTESSERTKPPAKSTGRAAARKYP